MASSPKDFTVAIVGGGMCGLACAIVLNRAGIDVNVFEAATKFGEVGAGVGFGPNSLRALKGLGLYDAALKAANEPPNMRLFRFIAGTGDHELIYDYANLAKSEEDQTGFGIYRPAFIDALTPLMDPSRTHFNKRCISVEKAASDRQLLRFADKSTFEADLIIGADGIRSAVRKVIVGDESSCLGFSNTVACRGLVPIDALKAEGMKVPVHTRPHCWTGLGKHLITFPMKNDTLLNVVAFISTPDGSKLSPEHPQPWVRTAPQQELLNGFQGFGNDAMTILKNIKTPSLWSIHTLHPPLKSFVAGRVVLVGDAAHGMLPHLGAGVGQGFEDVYTLYRLLTHPATKKSNLERALAIYDDMRPSRANMVLEGSIKAGNVYDGFGETKYSAEDMVTHLTGQWDPVWFYDIVAEVSDTLKQRENELFPSATS
ncbi:hypothetical protein NLJ89_g8712 [Agrocybe chaxingu]|uniref:FAD-binding domain-containing protein n=1 Tax=Agrocybe chaxingu TaxID=84603 RepID=A0A9W8JUD0_9AGAR|nr:hypothetical protein NLJ89_g8712 [Agrocybe chaxingu]